jgi:VanZ family protein
MISDMRVSGRVVVAWLLVGLYASAIFLFSSLIQPPVLDNTWQVSHLDKVYHSIGYAGLTLLLLYALGLTFVPYPSTHLAVWGVVLAISYGALNEFQQSFTSVRTMSVADGIANALGAGMAVWMWPAIQRWWPQIMTPYRGETRALPQTDPCFACGTEVERDEFTACKVCHEYFCAGCVRDEELCEQCGESAAKDGSV